MKEFYGQNSYDKGLTLIYGPAGAGKTTLLMQLLAKYLTNKQKVLVFDTEQGFDIKRLQQLMGTTPHWQDYLFMMPLKTFIEQEEKIAWLVDHADTFDFIGLDTLGAHYRKNISKDANMKLQMQFRLLKQLARKKPVVVANQVYSALEGDGVKPIGGKTLIDQADHVIELKKDPRIFMKIKPEKYIEYFDIQDEGLVF